MLQFTSRDNNTRMASMLIKYACKCRRKSGSFNWRDHEARINQQLPQYITPVEVDGFGTLKIHFVWMRSPRVDAVPLLLCHGCDPLLFLLPCVQESANI